MGTTEEKIKKMQNLARRAAVKEEYDEVANLTREQIESDLDNDVAATALAQFKTVADNTVVMVDNDDLVKYEGMTIRQIAAQENKHICDVILDIAVADELQEAIEQYGPPEIVNTDQGGRFTNAEFVNAVLSRHIRLSMDGKGCWRDNVFIERFWRTLKYEKVYLRAYDTMSAARQSLARYIRFYNGRRPHTANDDLTPNVAYFGALPVTLAA